ncbi:hypothetical protein JOB18_008672 [Solea senegalensis]|uniref:Uncharacterized protein n=1 Tax=Solea senegalensis TaxID=28829 RepID=A0AAV6PPV1_SOLSE|nr:hypothetical protein JOB18_008672 [Solea senegalensis]
MQLTAGNDAALAQFISANQVTGARRRRRQQQQRKMEFGQAGATQLSPRELAPGRALGLSRKEKRETLTE